MLNLTLFKTSLDLHWEGSLLKQMYSRGQKLRTVNSLLWTVYRNISACLLEHIAIFVFFILVAPITQDELILLGFKEDQLEDNTQKIANDIVWIWF